MYISDLYSQGLWTISSRIKKIIKPTRTWFYRRVMIMPRTVFVSKAKTLKEKETKVLAIYIESESDS